MNAPVSGKRITHTIFTLLIAPCVSYAASEEILNQMESAQQSIDSLECRFSVTRQSCGRYFLDENGVRDYELTLDSKQWIPPATYTFHNICSGNRFNRTEQGPDDFGNPVAYHDVWDEQQYIEYREGSGWALIFDKPKDVGAAFVKDPRCLAYRISPVRSTVDALRVGYAKGNLKMNEGVLKNIPIIYVECIYPQGQISDMGYKLWIDPARGFMPIQIQVNAGPFLCHQFMDIELYEVEPGVWFPIKGTIYNRQVHNKADRKMIGVIQKVEVDVASIKLNPELNDKTFSVNLPAGTEVHDRRTKPETIFQVSRAPDVDLDIMLETDVAQAEMASAAPVISAAGPRAWSARRLLVIGSSLACFGFAVGWLLTRSRLM